MSALQTQLELWKAPGAEPRQFVPQPGHYLRPKEQFDFTIQYLGRLLDRPPVVEQDGSGHTVWVFDAIGYRVNRRLPGVYPLYRDEAGRVRVGGFTTELYRPLASPNFLPFVLRYHGLVDDSRVRAQSPGRGLLASAETRLARQAYRHLLRDPRFQELRSRRLPEALGLDPELCRITLAARRTLAARIASDEYSLVWRHERELRAVARESPGLLPLAAAALEEGRILPYGDAVKELHLLFRYAKLAPATWRYVVRHGSRLLRPVWESVSRSRRMQAALEFLREIERAGHPAPPPAWALDTWLGFNRGQRIMLERGWNPVPPPVVRAALHEAGRVRGSAEEPVLREDLRLVFAWAEREAPALDKLQRRAGWPWLMKQATDAERRRALLEVEGPRTWPSPVRRIADGGLVATAVNSAEGLVEEAMALHNCIAGYIADCQSGRMRIFVVRDHANGRRVAVIRLDYERRSRAWVLHDVLGIANAPVSEQVRAFAHEVAAAYDEAAGSSAEPLD